MKRKNVILLCLILAVMAGAAYHFLKPTSLDFSKDEEPFRSMVMPPKDVWADSYMDGGSVVLRVVDGGGKLHEVTFPVEADNIGNPHPKAYNGDINAPVLRPLKDSARAKAIAVQLMKSYAKPRTHPSVDVDDLNEIPLRALSNPSYGIPIRAFEKMKGLFR